MFSTASNSERYLGPYISCKAAPSGMGSQNDEPHAAHSENGYSRPSKMVVPSQEGLVFCDAHRGQCIGKILIISLTYCSKSSSGRGSKIIRGSSFLSRSFRF